MLFLSNFTNKIDKKGRVSVPANFRAVIKQQEDFQGIVAYGSFTNDAIAASGMSYVEHLNHTIEDFDPYSEEKDAFATAILGSSYQLNFDCDGRILLTEELINLAKLTDKALFIGKGKSFEIWQPNDFELYAKRARDIAKEKRLALKYNNQR